MNRIHPTAVVGSDVNLGDNNVIGPFVVMSGAVTTGDDNWFGAGAIIGVPPEIRGHPHPPDPSEQTGPGVLIGHRNTFREYAQVHGGWRRATTVGNDAFVMNQTYLAHDTRLGDAVTLASGVRLAGHVVVQDAANLGMGAIVHQRRVVGAGAMIGMGAVVTRDIPPFAKAFGNPARIHGVNTRRLEQLGLSEDPRASDALRRLLSDPTSDLTGFDAVDAAFAAWRDWRS